MTMQIIFQFFSTLCSGLIAGLLFGYSCSVNIGLKSLADNEYLKAMQSINSAIQNLFFLVVFLSLLFVFPITSFMQYKGIANSSFYLILSATLLYFFGVFGVTMFYNVPLNEQLAQFDIPKATTNENLIMRHTFEKPWNYYHSIRTIASVISFVLTILAVIKSKF